MTQRSRQSGQNPFLAGAEVLQHVLLPHLSAVDLLQLSLCCKGVQAWLKGTPAALWKVSGHLCCLHSHYESASAETYVLYQGAPRDAAPEHLASLDSADQVLAALQNAYTARHSILAPTTTIVRVDTIQLPEVGTAAPEGLDCAWQYIQCLEAAFSTCGRWLAVALQASQDFRAANWLEEPFNRCYAHTHKVVVYRTAPAFKQAFQISSTDMMPRLSWHRTSPLLSVALLFQDAAAQQKLQPELAAFMVDARTGRQVSTLSTDITTAVLGTLPDASLQLSWSPCSKFLLVHGQRWDAGVGFLSVLDLANNRVLAESPFTSQISEGSAYDSPSALWYPGCSLGIVLPFDMNLGQSQTFSQAGIALGHLPEPFSCSQHSEFSTDAKHLIALGPGGRDDTAPSEKSKAVLGCSLEGSQFSFRLEHSFGPGNISMFWIPGTPSLLVREREETGSAASYDKVVALPMGSQPDRFLHETNGHHFSPSGRFLLDRGPGGLLMVDLETGKPVWDAAHRDPEWPELTKLQRTRALRGEPLGVGVGHSAWCQGWCPTGTGLVCTIDERKPMPGPPRLRMFWLA